LQEFRSAANAVGTATIATAAAPAANSGVMYCSFIPMMALLEALDYVQLPVQDQIYSPPLRTR
jgi:hypothetical protein